MVIKVIGFEKRGEALPAIIASAVNVVKLHHIDSVVLQSAVGGEFPRIDIANCFTVEEVSRATQLLVAVEEILQIRGYPKGLIGMTSRLTVSRRYEALKGVSL